MQDFEKVKRSERKIIKRIKGVSFEERRSGGGSFFFAAGK